MRQIRNSGFTIIELMVTVGIIAILAAILLPVLARARESGKQSACASNLKQVALALDMYASDYSGRLPDHNAGRYTSYAADGADEPDEVHRYFCQSRWLHGADAGWSDLVVSYLGGGDAMLCPSRGVWPGYPRTSYEYKLWFAFNPVRDQVEHPAGVALVWEQWSYHAGYHIENDTRAVLNVAFADGHVRFAKMSEASTADYPNGPDLHGMDRSGKLLPAPYPRRDF